MKLFIKIAISIIIVLILVFAGGIFYLTRGLEAGVMVEVNEAKPIGLGDGTYNGKYESGRWSNEVKVTVEEGRITKIDIVKDVAFAKPEWAEQVLNSVIEKQSTDVDIVSGSTITSKAYLKSIQNALENQEG